MSVVSAAAGRRAQGGRRGPAAARWGRRRPAAHVRRPRLDYESHAVALDRNELGALLVAAGLGPPPEHALISLLALNDYQVTVCAARSL